MTSNCRRRAIYRLLRSPSQTCHAKPKTQINRRRTLPASFPLVDVTASSLVWKTSLRKSQDAVALQQIKERGAYSMIDRGDIRQQLTVAAISGLHCRALVMVSSSIRLTAWLQNSKKRAERSERLMYEQSHRDYLRSVICIIVCLSWAVNHYRDNAITLQSPARQNARELKLANAYHRHADASAWCCCAWCKIHEGVSWC